MKAMILAAGGATRLYPLTYTLPKPLVPILNIPVIEHIIHHLVRHGFDELTVNVHYSHRMLMDRLQDGSQYGARIEYSYEPELMGTAGGVKFAAERFQQETFLVINSDDMTDLDLKAMLEFHRSHRALATMAVATVRDVTDYGILEMDIEGRVTWFLEKPSSDKSAPGSWNNCGIYLCEPELLDQIPARVYDFGKDLFPELVRQRLPFYGFPIADAFWYDVGTLQNYREAHWHLLRKHTTLWPSAVESRPGIWTQEGVRLHPDARLTGPMLLGPRVQVHAGAEIIGPAVLGEGNIVEEGALVKNSILWEYTRVLTGARVEDCLVGAGSTLQSGSHYQKMVLGSGSRESAESRESSR
jgi:NDP-sugar pyrophosphorylase family protein